MAQYSTVLIMTHFEHITPACPWHDAENTSMKDARWRSKARSAWTGITSRLTRIIARMFVLRSILNRFTTIWSLIANIRLQFVEKRKGRKEKELCRIFFQILSICRFISMQSCTNKFNFYEKATSNNMDAIFSPLFFFYFEFLFHFILYLWIKHFRK